ncbi:hypothetical protein HUJ05_006337 [Dendroctonus ponderosae]|nr:hypothetical protein HUJ05_006337 [Dendroctonus ponderosae]
MALLRHGRSFLKNRMFNAPVRHQHGYIVLLPEIGEEAPEKNPLYHNDGLPKFTQITIENCRAAMAQQTMDFEMGVQEIENKLTNSQCSDAFKDIIDPIEKLGNIMETTWGLSKTLYLGNNTLMPTSSYVAIHERARRARAAKYTSKTVHSVLKNELEENRERTVEQTRVLQKFRLEGKLNGLELVGRNADIFKHDFAKLNIEKKNFKFKNDLSLRQHSQIVGEISIVGDFPEDLLQATAMDPNNYKKGPWKFTLMPHVYTPLMQHCPNREIRWLLWKSNATRGSVVGEKELATSLHVEEIRFLRANIANYLGYKSYADMSMETKMAGSRSEVNRVLGLLLDRARPAQDEELDNLLIFANEHGFRSDRLELWDVPYWRLKQKQLLFGYDENKLKDFFPLNTVLNGMFQLCEKLFNIVIKVRSGVTGWHKDVRFYDIFEPHSSAPVAGFYLDPYARSEDKFKVANSGWMVGIQNVKMLFEKFGHSLQHLLTRTYYSEVAGLSNVEWDAVGISGHMLSHWLYNEEVMRTISCHCGSGDKLSQATFEKICQAEQHMAGLDLCNELYLSALDLELYSSKDYWLDIVKRLWPQYKSFEYQYKIDAHPCHFTQIFVEDWAAAYYSHVWSRMVAADVYSAFYEVRDNEQQTKDVGKRFRDTFLAMGGSEHPSKVFREFRGRDPSHKALLKSLGLKKPQLEN